MSYQDTLATPFNARLTADDFLLLDRAGAFDAYAKTELIDGTVVAVNARYSDHFKVKVRLLRRLADACDALGGGLEAWSEGSIALSSTDVPEPDIFVTDIEPTAGLVASDTVRLIVEIASTTLERGMGDKLRMYADAGIAEYWVVDVRGRRVHRMWNPIGGAYLERREVLFGEPITAATIAGLRLETTIL